jgi:hypothetical protein
MSRQSMQRKMRSYWMGPEERAYLEAIQKVANLKNQSEAVRYAIQYAGQKLAPGANISFPKISATPAGKGSILRTGSLKKSTTTVKSRAVQPVKRQAVAAKVKASKVATKTKRTARHSAKRRATKA